MPNSVTSDEQTARAYLETKFGSETVAPLERYVELLLTENRSQNLISKPSESAIWQRHIVDSAQLLEFVPRETFEVSSKAPWLDLGSGPGLPGLVIATIRPQWPVILVESRKRRVAFLEDCIDRLQLQHCSVIGERLEQIEPFEAQVISARAFAPLTKLLRLSAPFSTRTTRYLLPKGRSAAHELAEAKPKVRKMFHVEQSLTDPDAGIIVSR